MRIHRALARAGIASRRKAEELIAAGRVTVNGAIAKVGQSVDPDTDVILVDGKRVDAPPTRHRWIALHKPAGVMTTSADTRGRQTVFELVPEIPGLSYVGRLDLLTEGLLLFTTDGTAVHALTHPSRGIERVYVATVIGNAKAAAAEARKGVELSDGPVRPRWVEVRSLGDRRWAFEVALAEGRHREVRRLCQELDLVVERLVRVAYGPISLGKLPVGAWRELTPREVSAIYAALAPAAVEPAPPKGVAPPNSERKKSTPRKPAKGRTRA